MANNLIHPNSQSNKSYFSYISNPQTSITNHISCQIQRQNVARQNATFPFAQLNAKIFE